VISALVIDRIEGSDIVVDGDEIVSISTERSTAENVETIRATPHARLPRFGESPAEVVGTVSAPRC
jgi:Mg2+/Co2+ transporter CorB